MENPASILLQISALKDSLDQVNEEIEQEIQRTGDIESELVQCFEKEKDLLREEDELIKVVNTKESKLNDLMALFVVSKKALELTEERLVDLEKSRDEVSSRINSDRENFIDLCRQFQQNVESARKNQENANLLSTKEHLEERIIFLKKEIETVNCSNIVYAEEEGKVAKLQSFIHGLRGDICSKKCENEKLLKDIEGLKTAIEDANEFEDLSWMQIQIDTNEEEKRQLEDCILGFQTQLSRLLDEEQRLANAYKEQRKVLQLLEDE